ncbi:MAG: inositol-3-phosphate synthase [Labilithrix sp.]|nr:inositol-3-phosphate synthase [Labilithrix sp.]
MKRPATIEPAKGKLAVLLPGLGAVATTFIAGVALARRNLAAPVGSLTQLATIRLGKRTERRSPKISDFVPLAQLDQLEFGAWDIFEDDALASAEHSHVLRPDHLEAVKDELRAIRPMRGVFYPEFVRRLHGTHVKRGSSKADMVAQLRQDIRTFMRERACDRAVAVWCGSTEVYTHANGVHASIVSFEEALAKSDPSITNSQMYAWALLKERVPFANGSPNLAVDFPAASELAREVRMPIAGKDFKTGQTLMKTIIAPGLKARMLGIHGWYSTNILGNRDGEVLDDPDSFRSKEVSKLSVLDNILQPQLHPELYGDLVHKVRIDYYPPRGDDKEGWDSIDLHGWLGYPMQMKINFLCRDSILAAPIVLDLVLFLDLARRAGLHGMQEWLSFYFKSPMHAPEVNAEHDLFIQHKKLKNTLRWVMGEEPLTHVGNEYYE